MTTITLADYHLSPPILVTRGDHSQLIRLALPGAGHGPDASDDLLHELDRAKIIDDLELPPDVVRMGSRVRYRIGRDERTVELCWPADADIAQRRISVLTPVGTALIGLSEGQSISFRTRDGRPQMLTVLSVLPPQGDGGEGPQAA